MPFQVKCRRKLEIIRAELSWEAVKSLRQVIRTEGVICK